MLLLILGEAMMAAEIINKAKEQLPSWVTEAKLIYKLFEFQSFEKSIVFTNKVASLAESLDHHPDILIQYNKVKITCSTHDVGGLSIKDIHLAQQIDALEI